VAVSLAFDDGSSLHVPDLWLRASALKDGEEGWAERERTLREYVEDSVVRGVVATKFGEMPLAYAERYYGEPIRTKADVAEKALYCALRPAIMALAMEEMAASAGRKAPKVAALNDDGTVTVYGGGAGARVYPNAAEAVADLEAMADA